MLLADSAGERRARLASLPVTALVTAFNEEETIGGVIGALRAAPSVGAVQVVDDGSTDATRAVALAAGASVISLPARIPVGEAILRHLDDLDDERIILWCDADLTGLEPGHIEALIARLRRGDVSQSLSSRGLPSSWRGAWRNRATRAAWAWFFGPLSGERAMLLSDFRRWIADARALGWREMLSGYGLVLYLNWRSRQDGLTCAITYFDTLRQRYKHAKWGRRGLREAVAQWLEFARVWLKIRLFAPPPVGPATAQGRAKSEKSIS